MINFAVWHEGLEEDQGRWVLDVDPAKGVLLSGNDGSLYWRPLADCRLVRAATPDQPIAVVPIQPQPANNIVIPGANNGFLAGRN